MIEVEMWAIKDVEKDELIMTKFGRSLVADDSNYTFLWKHKQSPNSVEGDYLKQFHNDMLQPVKVKVMEILND